MVAVNRFNVDSQTSPFVTRATNFVEKQSKTGYGTLKGVAIGETVAPFAFAADALVHSGLALAKGSYAVLDTTVSLLPMGYNLLRGRNVKTLDVAGLSHFSVKEAGIHLYKAIACVAMIALNVFSAVLPGQSVKLNRALGLAKVEVKKGMIQKAKDAIVGGAKAVKNAVVAAPGVTFRAVKAAPGAALDVAKTAGKTAYSHKGKIAAVAATGAGVYGASKYYDVSLDPRQYNIPGTDAVKNGWYSVQDFLGLKDQPYEIPKDVCLPGEENMSFPCDKPVNG